ncbi:DUF4038 domain-containing protein [Ulvibacterium sp.]|uniref:apiosidase-like domain-containing protein n=1 Tax=Ulvibacterium sp. TaxID=2665914 RepID=UPI0026060538|nr:DUF4038 domain-containing protein [Ulvibacterium sp.]
MKTTLLLASLILFFFSSALAQVSFPLSVSKNERHLIDMDSVPFFYQADTPWHLFFDLKPMEAEYYVERRKEQGFNALQIMLTGSKGQLDFNGESPWLGDHDFSRPNEKFFERVDAVLEIAKNHNMYIAIVPLWSGCCRGDMAGNDVDGNPLPMMVNGAKKTYEFGKWLGNRYGKYPNIMWIIGGDNDPFNAIEEYGALVKGLMETTTDQLFTYHAASTHSSTDVYPGANWLDVSMIYTYFRGFNKAWNKIQPDVYEVAYDEYRKNKMPFFLGESNYEREHDDWGNPTQIRKQAYWAALSGSAGHAYGSVNWKIPENWKEVLELEGALSLIHLANLMEHVGFETLEPDWLGTLLGDSAGEYASNNYAISAFTRERTGAVVYVPSKRRLKLNSTSLSRPINSLKWYNPRTGERSNILSKKGFIVPPSEEDWVLLVNY